jgi:hypothetical protein
MIEQEQDERPGEGAASAVTAEEMAAALEQVKAAAPTLAAKLKEAGLTPREKLASSHDHARGGEHGPTS